ncbi:aminopeptidase P family protein [Desulfovibrio sp. OttesenSCG-928-A18]|nr:aminopeptidase P family protein [Desulfovibrio sp. OttesenSCG-928-A18]
MTQQTTVRSHEARRETARALMRQAGLSALLISLDANRYYLSGFELHDAQINESSGCLLLMKDGRDWLCTDSRFLDAARRIWDEERIFIYHGRAMEQINALLKDKAGGTVGFEARSLSLAAYEHVGAGLSMQRADGLVESLRMIKDADEVAAMERSCALNEQLMRWLPGVLTPGRTEAQVAWDIEQFFRNNGAEEMAFPSIVGVGPNAALPHAEPGATAIGENCGVLVDTGCRLSRYCSDQTRSFWVGEKPDPQYTADLELIKEAQALAIAMIAPGVTGVDVYTAVKSFLDARGVGDLFTHGLGHGIGLQTHEAPSLSSLSQGVLKAGMVVTVEPGLYRPGKSGVRWEHMVLVTENGARVL